MPAAGVALTFPAGWTVSVDVRRSDPPPGQPVPGGARWIVLTATGGSDALDGCRLFRYEASGLALAAFAEALLADQPATLTAIRVDAGEALRVDVDLGVAETARQYLFSSDDTFYQLACLGADRPPVDDWQALAETLEVLHTEG